MKEIWLEQNRVTEMFTFQLWKFAKSRIEILALDYLRDDKLKHKSEEK